MILTKPSYEILRASQGVDLEMIEIAGRTCYKSEISKDREGRAAFIKKINDLGHHSVLEHSILTVRFIIDRGVSHELVRHRLCAFSQESTRYCDYKGEVEFIIPPWVDIKPGRIRYANVEGIYFHHTGDAIESSWMAHMCACEEAYIELREDGWAPQQARSVLPNSLKTEIVVSANFREWIHIFKLRYAKPAHPQMREIMIPLRDEMAEMIPEVFA